MNPARKFLDALAWLSLAIIGAFSIAIVLLILVDMV